jgi:nucleoside-diphosphate-sugar epimerase
MRILLIGGNGFIGSPLTRELLDGGNEVAILYRGGEKAPAERLHDIRGDRNDLSTCHHAIQEFSPEVIVDLILSSGRQASHLMEFARGITTRVVALSSGDVYRAWGVLLGVEPGAFEPVPITEESPLRSTRKLYPPEATQKLRAVFSWIDEEYDKIAVEQVVMNTAGIAGTVLRLPMVYGPGDPLHRLFPVVKRIADGRQRIPLADAFAAWRGPRSYVDNVAHAIALAATREQAAGRIYNVCEEPCLPELEWQKRIAASTGWSGKFVVLPASQIPAHLRVPGNAAQHVVMSSTRIRAELQYSETVDTDNAIARTASWEKNHPPRNIDPQQFDYAAEDQVLAGAA